VCAGAAMGGWPTSRRRGSWRRCSRRTYAPRRLFLTYFNRTSSSAALHVRRLLNVVDLYVSVDILECPALARLISSLQPLAETDTTDYEEVKAYGVPERRRVLAPCRTRASSAPRAATASSSACATARTSPTSSAGALVLGGAGPVVKLLRARAIFIKKKKIFNYKIIEFYTNL